MKKSKLIMTVSVLIILFLVSLESIHAEEYNITIDNEAITLGRTTKVTITITGSDSSLSNNVYVRLFGCGIDNLGYTNSNGKISFSISPSSTGEINIDVESEGNTASEVVTVSTWILDVSLDKIEVSEGETFTVTVLRDGTEIAVEGATVTVADIGTYLTDSNGEVTLTAPEVSSDRTYTISASADGYAPDPSISTITVINVPKLVVTIDETTDSNEAHENEVTIYVSTESGSPVTGATVHVIYLNETITTLTTHNGQTKFNVEHKEVKNYSATAVFNNFLQADIQFKIKSTENDDYGTDSADGNNSEENSDEKHVSVSNIGNLIDNNNDGVYDSFFSKTIQKETTTEIQTDGTYLIDEDGDSDWDYVYNPATGEINTYTEKDETPGFGIIILLSAILLVFSIKRRRACGDSNPRPIG